MHKILTGPLCRAARALVEWPLEQLAHASGVDRKVITDFEARACTPDEATQRRLFAALETAGAVFIPENGGGVGVRLKYTQRDVRSVNKLESEGGKAGEDDI